MDLSAISGRLAKLDQDRRKLALSLREKDGFSAPILKKPLSGKIAGVDGGLVSKQLHGIDLTMVRAAGCVMDFEGDGLKKIEYLPAAYVQPALHCDADGMEDEDYSTKSSLYRLKEEIGLAVEILRSRKTDMLVLDGSVLPQQPDKPRKGSPAYPAYENIVSLYKELFDLSSQNKIPLLGVVEDSRSKMAAELLNTTDDALLHTIDTVLFAYALNEGEASFCFPYSKNPKEHPILRDFPGYAEKIKCFYLKTAKYDRPVRVEFFDYGLDYKEIASTVLSLSFHREYGFPSVLVEADLQARLSASDLEDAYCQIKDSAGENPALLEKRRNMRPF